MLTLVYHDQYVTPLPDGHRFPMAKFGILRDLLAEQGFQHFHAPEPAARQTLQAVHDPDYLNAFLRGALTRDQQRVMGLPWSPGLVQRTVRAVGGTLLTTQLALQHGLAANCAGGTHHAHRDYGSGFCLLNDLAVAAQHALDEHQLHQVLILDLDVHQGDGTARLFQHQPRVFTASLHCGKTSPHAKPKATSTSTCPKA